MQSRHTFLKSVWRTLGKGSATFETNGMSVIPNDIAQCIQMKKSEMSVKPLKCYALMRKI